MGSSSSPEFLKSSIQISYFTHKKSYKETEKYNPLKSTKKISPNHLQRSTSITLTTQRLKLHVLYIFKELKENIGQELRKPEKLYEHSDKLKMNETEIMELYNMTNGI